MEKNERRNAEVAKIVNCEDCIYMYHCERTYLGGCDTGVEWGAANEEGESGEKGGESDEEMA